jgi:hypothetical protein
MAATTIASSRLAEAVRKGGAKYFIGLAVRNTPAGECLAETDIEQIAG